MLFIFLFLCHYGIKFWCFLVFLLIYFYIWIRHIFVSYKDSSLYRFSLWILRWSNQRSGQNSSIYLPSTLDFILAWSLFDGYLKSSNIITLFNLVTQSKLTFSAAILNMSHIVHCFYIFVTVVWGVLVKSCTQACLLLWSY